MEARKKNHMSISWKLSEHAHSDYFLMMECVGGISEFFKNASRTLFLGSNNKYLISAIRKNRFGPILRVMGVVTSSPILYWSMLVVFPNFLKMHLEHCFWAQTTSIWSRQYEKIGLGPFWGLWGSWRHHLYYIGACWWYFRIS